MTIRKAKASDLPEIFGLVKQLAEFENDPHAITSNLQEYADHFGITFNAFVAESENQVIGMALYYYAWSTWKGKMMYLEDFVVHLDHRRKGIGQLLFDALIDEAKSTHCKLMKWEVLDWNKSAIAFYKKNKATIHTNWWDGKIIF